MASVVPRAEGDGGEAVWGVLDEAVGSGVNVAAITREALLWAAPDANIAPEQAADFLRKAIEGFEYLRPHLDEAARQRDEELLDAHQRVREAARLKGARYRVEPQLPPDMLGIYVNLPVAK